MAGEAVFDKLIFALDGDLSGLKARYAEAEAGAKKTGTTIQQNLGTGFKQAADEINQHTSKIRASLKDIDDSSKSLGGNIAVSRREMVYLVREMVSGDWQRAPATIALLATHMMEIPGAAIAAGAAILAIPAAVIISAIKAENALAGLRTSLAMTASFSGLSTTGADAIAKQIAGGGGYSATGARQFVSGALSNFVPSNAIAQAGSAARNFTLAGGGDANAAQALIKQMFEDPAKSAEALNAQFHLLTTAQTQEVDNLTKSGELEKAGHIILDAFNTRVADAAQQASWFSKALDYAGTKLGSFFSRLGTVTGAGGTDVDKLAILQRERDQIAAHGLPGGRGGAAGQRNALSLLDSQMAPLAAAIANANRDAAAKGSIARADVLAGKGLADYQGGVGKFDAGTQTLKDHLADLNTELTAAWGNNSQYTASIAEQRDAVQKAIPFQKTAAQLETERAKDAAAVAAAPPEKRAVVQGQLAARRVYEANMANPNVSAKDANSIYHSQLQIASVANDRLTDRQDKALAGMQAEADMQTKIAAAYRQSASAAEGAKIIGEAHTALVKGEIRDEGAYAAALLKRAFAQESAAVAQKIANDNETVAHLRAIGGAGSNQAAISELNAQYDAHQATAKESAAADASGDIKSIHQASLDYFAALSAARAKDAATSQIDGNKEINTLEQQNAVAKLNLDLKYADADVRAKAIADLEVEQEMANSNLVAGTDEYNQRKATLLVLKETAATLATMGDTNNAQIIDFLHTGLTSTLTAGVHGFKSLSDAASNFFSQLAEMTVQLYIIKPLLNGLFGIFGGGSDHVGGSAADLFGGGKASGGNIDPGKFYLVGENGPEILGGIGGKITPISASSGQSNSGGQTINFSIVVGGNGDKELLQRMNDVAAATVVQAIQQNNKVAQRIQRGSLINSTKRALI